MINNIISKKLHPSSFKFYHEFLFTGIFSNKLHHKLPPPGGFGLKRT